MESAVGFYANKPLVVCCRHVLGRARQSTKQETTQVGGNSQEMSAWRGGPACTMLAHYILPRRGWHPTPLSITCDDESCVRLLSPVKSRWRLLSARWRWAQRGGCQGRASGWRKLVSGGWEADCDQRRSPRCPVDGRSAVGAHAKPLGSEGRQSSMPGWTKTRKRIKLMCRVENKS